MWFSLVFLGAYAQSNSTNAEPRAAGSSPPSTMTLTGKGITFGFQYFETVGKDRVMKVSCIGSPPTANGGSCDMLYGDTLCSTSLPMLCVNNYAGYRPCYSANYPDQDGWVGGSLALTDPVSLSSFNTRADADAYCIATFGPGWKMSEVHDGRWCLNMLSYCKNTWAGSGCNSLGYFSFIGWANFPQPTQRFWVFNQSPPSGIGHCFF